MIEQVLRITVNIVGSTIAVYILISLGYFAWFQPDRFEKMITERLTHHPLGSNVRETFAKEFVSAARLASAIGLLGLPSLAKEFFVEIMSLLK